MAEAGKGDTQRPTDQNKFATNWDIIWGKRGSSSTQSATPAGQVTQTESTQTEAPIASPATNQPS
jgi:hypothetical protein